ncbi:MAG: molybdenum cofactor guanylyltransferase, partial [Chloroflexota bacterium]
KTCLPRMRERIERGDLKILRLTETLRTRTVDERDLGHIHGAARSFMNVNTPEDWAEVQRMVAETP